MYGTCTIQEKEKERKNKTRLEFFCFFFFFFSSLLLVQSAKEGVVVGNAARNPCFFPSNKLF